MSRQDDGRTPWSVTAPFVLLAVVGIGLAGLHLRLDSDPLWEEILDAFILVGLSSVLFYEAREVRNAGLSPDAAFRVFLGTLSAGLGVALLALAYVVVRNVTGSPLGEDWYVVFGAGLVGASVGAPAFRYYSQLEAELGESRELNKRLQVSQRALRHNLRNELAIILGHVDDLATGGEDDDALSRLRTVREHLDELVSLSENSQALTSVWETDGVQAFDLQEVVAAAVEVVCDRHPDCHVSFSVESDLRVSAHERFQLAVVETIENAVQHTPPGAAVDVSASTVGDDDVRLVVADTGHGIPRLDVNALSQRSETPTSHGRGLGLWLIYWIVEKSDGSVEFEPNEPRGTRVLVTLPTPD